MIKVIMEKSTERVLFLVQETLSAHQHAGDIRDLERLVGPTEDLT